MGRKKLVPKWRSEKSSKSAASRTLKQTSTSSEATSQDQTVSGIRLRVMPSQRSPTMVARMIDRADPGGDAEDGDAGEPHVHAERLAGAGRGDGAERGIAVQPEMGAPPGTMKAASSTSERESSEPERDGVHRWQRHAASADLFGQNEVREAAQRRGGEHEEDHQRAVHGDEGEIVFGLDLAEEGKREVGPDEVDSHDEREDGSGGDGDEREQEILDSDDAVVGGEEPGERVALRRGLPRTWRERIEFSAHCCASIFGPAPESALMIHHRLGLLRRGAFVRAG